MSLATGTRLGPFEIVEQIGAGGMGTVYKALDTKLSREVAIKVLPEAFAENKERLSRFEREARLLASLNHSNIATLFDLQESDGVHFLVLELVRGETLAERIARGPIPVDGALPLFKQIAEALEVAHGKGIIHRDLKPANIKVTPEGKVKVLDFGLAKAMLGEEPVLDASQSPKLTKDTALGAILGTAAYMSPEQARGKPMDKRTDIWAFGCCLFEALTGRKAFEGETVTDTLATIINKEPNWRALSETVPTAVSNLLRRCLRKDSNRRFRDVWDVRIAVRSLETGEQRVLIKGGTYARYVPTGHVVFAREGSLLAAPFDLERLQITAPPVGILDNLSYIPNTGMAHFAISDNGTLVYRTHGSDGPNRRLVWVDREGKASPITKTLRAYSNPRLSPDGQKLAVTIGTADSEVWVQDLARGFQCRGTQTSF